MMMRMTVTIYNESRPEVPELIKAQIPTPVCNHKHNRQTNWSQDDSSLITFLSQCLTECLHKHLIPVTVHLCAALTPADYNRMV